MYQFLARLFNRHQSNKQIKRHYLSDMTKSILGSWKKNYLKIGGTLISFFAVGFFLELRKKIHSELHHNREVDQIIEDKHYDDRIQRNYYGGPVVKEGNTKKSNQKNLSAIKEEEYQKSIFLSPEKKYLEKAGDPVDSDKVSIMSGIKASGP